ERHNRALQILSEIGSLAPATDAEKLDQETLGIAGGIHKRKWEAEGQLQDLETSLGYYLRGWRHRDGVTGDYGYTAINAAYVLDCLAAQEEASMDSSGPQTRRAEARTIRQELVRALPRLCQQGGYEWLGQQWWFHVTVAEAAFGIADYDEAA